MNLLIDVRGDINKLKSLLLSGKNDIKIHELDNFDDDEILYNNIFKNNYTLKNLIKLKFHVKIKLDLLENIFDITTDSKNNY